MKNQNARWILLFCFSLFLGKGYSQILPDLVVTSIQLTPVSGRVYTGTTIKLPLDVTIKNTGNKDIIYSSTNQIFIPVVLKTYGASHWFYASGGVKTLRIGQSEKITINIKLPATIIGKNMLFQATVDPCQTNDDIYPCPVGSFEELNENNNSKSTQLKVPTYYKATIPPKLRN